MSYKGSLTKYCNRATTSTITPQGRAECRVSLAESAGSTRVSVELRGDTISAAILTVRSVDLELLSDSLRDAVRAMRNAKERAPKASA
jgi:hypothetical protein